MNRRGFLAGLAALPVAIAAGDLLWLPSQKIISIPSAGFLSLSDELAYIIRRNFIQKLVVQLYETSPVMRQLIQREVYL